MRLVPSAKRLAYLPRTPREKSYSGRTSLSILLAAFFVGAVLVAFFILDPFSTGGESSVYDSRIVTTLDVSDDQQPVLIGDAQHQESPLLNRMVRVGDRDG